MTDTLLTTKFNIPQTRHDLVRRPRLIEKLNSGLNGRLILVSSPAGFGKTTLVTDWLSQLPATPHPWQAEHCAWISLDPNDNEPVRFLRYLITAIQTIYPTLGGKQQETLDQSPDPNFQTITRDLLNEISAHNQPLLIILDDHHEIHNEIIQRILHTIIDYLPMKAFMVITTRQDPPLALPRWRARSWLSDISADDLRFDRVETEAFLTDTMQLDLNPEAMALLEERTEGWVAGLQLAALSLTGSNISPGLIEQFSGRNRYIAEYLVTEVLDQQSTEIQQFLLATSILDRFNSSLCTVVLHAEDNPEDINLIQLYQNLIERLERTNIFIVPLDRESYWYRYHHLFAQLLRQRLERMMPEADINNLYSRAARWFAEHNFLDEAIRLALQGKDFAFSASLITGIQPDSLWNQTPGLQLREWGTEIPTKIFLDYPQAALHIALAHMSRNEIKEAIRYIDPVRGDPRVEAEIFLIDSIFIRNRGDIHQALKLANEAAQLFETENKTFYIAAKTQSIVCLMTLGHLTEAEDQAILLQREILTKSGQNFNVYIQLIQILGLIRERRGNLIEAERLYLDGIELVENSEKTLPLIGLLLVRLGAIYYQWNEIERATEYCENGLAWGERTGIGDILTHGLLVQVDLAIQRQDKTAAKALLKRLSATLDWPEFRDLYLLIQANHAYFDVRLGNLAPAIRWANASGLSLGDTPTLSKLFEYQSLARVRLEEIHQLGMKDQVPKIMVLVNRLIDLVTAHNLTENVIFCWSLKALMFDLSGQMRQATEALHQALDMAFSGGFIRIFIDFGAPMRDLIQKSLAYEPHMVYKRRLLMAFSDEMTAPPTSVSSISSAQEISITLTSREFEILQLIASGLSNKAIQEHLMLSKNTIRTHIKNLYSKLGVHSRTQAIQQARESGLI